MNKNIDFPEGDFGQEGDLYVVPAGKRLVIEYVGVVLNLPTGQHATTTSILTFDVVQRSFNGVLPVPVQLTGTAFSTDFFSGGALVKAYVEAGGAVQYNVGRTDTAGAVSAGITISGYLVNVP